ncbi:hypothetical protein BASA81_012623 [Batrachochytrium salamandrivorans]|nr:hypothetical protein BASA81_012623 [Batrachochytrium salamandrivorans]
MKLIVSFSLLFVGSVLGLVLNWARLGTADGQAWSLVHPCPVCFDVSKLLSPIMALDKASKLALHMVSLSFVLSLVAMTLVLFNKPKSYVEMVLGVGGIALALSPLVFALSVPNEFPVFMENGSYAAMAFGTLTAVGAISSVTRSTSEQASQDDVRDGLAEAVEEGKRLVSPKYGTNNNV